MYIEEKKSKKGQESIENIDKNTGGKKYSTGKQW